MAGRIWRRVRTLLGRRAFDADVKREIESHLAMETEHRARHGSSRDEARRAALRDFGAVSRVMEEVHDARGITFWDTLRQDLKFGWRTLRRSPGYTTAAVLILALGIGVNTTMFSVISGVLLKPLPFPDGDELVLVQQSAPASNVADAGVSILELTDYRRRLQSVRDLVEFHGMNFVLLNQGEPDRIDAGVVSASFFDVLGIRPLLGRTFVDEDDDIGAEAVLVLSHAYWREKFGGDEHVVGRVLQMNNRPHTVVGVLPPFPQYPRDNDVYMSTSACPFRAAQEVTPRFGHRSFAALRVFGRLVPGATVEQVSTEVATVAESFNRDYASDHDRTRSRGLAGRSVLLRDQLTTGARPLLYALTAATLLVLLIACANVANLALARAVRRSRELAVRTALGAGRMRLFRQLVTESLLVAFAGGVLGLGLASLTLDLLVQFIGRFTTRTAQIEIDAGVLAFALAASVCTGLAFGAAPALAVRRGVISAIRDGGSQAGEGTTRHRLRAALVVGQIAVSFVLLVGAALLLQSFYRLAAVPLGYRSDDVMTASYGGNFSRMATPAEARRVQGAILEKLRSSPGVRSAAVTNAVPQSNIVPLVRAFTIEGRTPREGIRLEADGNIASGGYFDLLGIRLLGGRDFRSSDTDEAPAVAVINASMAALWDGADPIGSRFTTPGPNNQPITPTVVGVVTDFRLYGADRDVEAQFYVPYTQVPFPAGRLLVLADSGPSALIPAIKAAVHGVDPEIPVEDVQTLDELRNGRLATPGVTTGLLTIFAAVALAITLTGIAGLIGTSVSQRTREFGLRMALGASRGSVLRLVIGQGAVLAAVGIVLGIGGALGFSRLIARFLFETAATEPRAYGTVAAVFLVAALLATLGPARRATAIDPLEALRSE